ncbi:MAG TPA: DUF2313 domain-containing protein [Thermodesulfovibrio thiophilus]|nr:DUF2313 domain-containing protein [Thermodesulfovibrio thiophilus]
MSREIVLIDYLPPFLQGYREIQAIMTAENPEFQAVSDEGQVVLDNTFIMYCSEKGIARFEKMLGIYPLPTDTLDSRRSRVLTRWNEVVPYTLKSFLSKLTALQGNDNIQITFFNDQYKIQVVTHLEKHGQQDALAYLFRTVLPCNLVVESINILDAKTGANIMLGSGITYTNIEFITNDIKETFDEVSDLRFANAITGTEIISIATSI